MSPPDPETQVQFLFKIQRLLSEGGFVATYKFALLVALGELAVERGDDTTEHLELDTGSGAGTAAPGYGRRDGHPASRAGGAPEVRRLAVGPSQGLARLARIARASRSDDRRDAAVAITDGGPPATRLPLPEHGPRQPDPAQG